MGLKLGYLYPFEHKQFLNLVKGIVVMLSVSVVAFFALLYLITQ